MKLTNVGVLAAVIGLGCDGSAAPPSPAVALTPRAVAPADCNPLKPPPSREMPEALEQAFPRDPQGRPVITGQDGLGLVYDSKLDDPISRWGACLSRVAAVQAANPAKGKITHCIDSMKVCPTNAGGDDCCPQACIDKFKERTAAGDDEETAMNASFVEGSCVQGFPAPTKE